MTPEIQHWSALALMVIGVGGFLFSNRAAIGGFFSGAISKLTPAGLSTTSPAPDDDTLDFQALSRLQKRFTKRACPEGKAAVDTCLQHFWHGTEGQA